jgi:hypothetical protein
MTPTHYILLWTSLLVVGVYLLLAVRYQFRTSADVTVLQCTADTFRVDLLRERQPVVCGGFADTRVFEKLRAAAAATASATADDAAIYQHLAHIRPWFSHPEPVYRQTVRPATSPLPSRPAYTASTAEVSLIVQLEGTSRIWLVHPSHMSRMPDAPDYTEVVLHAGYGLFVPFMWWVHDVDDGGGESPSRFARMAWTNPITRNLHAYYLRVSPNTETGAAPPQSNRIAD